MEEGIEMSLVTYSVIVGGFSKAGNAEIEGSGGELTKTLQKTFPPDWSSHHHHHHRFLDQVSDVDDDGEDNDDDVNLVSGFLSSK
ncbi:hypothetical protein Bca52824_045980 [Brassica carinata]|uniref:Uncharacterized protein n=1 Tax=Brassica carinata TaxID=52824 RepID=A0A8X7RDH0_BRACI|nr:hypothetical protein Bca52824_045980 [Brassica carinata]